MEIQKEVELKEKELQMQYKMKELELKGKDVLENKEPHTAVAKEGFDFTRHVKMVPSFQEHEVDKFFLHFEKIAANLHWPSGARTILLQSVLIGKAREVYSALSVEESTDYDLVKVKSCEHMSLFQKLIGRSFVIQNVRKERRIWSLHVKKKPCSIGGVLPNRWVTTMRN